jgi:hypothetical protein
MVGYFTQAKTPEACHCRTKKKKKKEGIEIEIKLSLSFSVSILCSLFPSLFLSRYPSMRLVATTGILYLCPSLLRNFVKADKARNARLSGLCSFKFSHSASQLNERRRHFSRGPGRLQLPAAFSVQDSLKTTILAPALRRQVS